ncbi:beta-glucoside-specific PTS transporter subunit IIABC [Lactiplantibacillus plantarum]|uniref:beta-glucoside-specific PTS transporter subunit IIABC n=1 Tax=Lactiplantibacillus plantarum TaxID=1590 RepID=UPI0018A00DE7|nr:beta-glucoside-specific PTS transporter subunit IIABC [Lactiplantibacillus plantarum]
MNKSKLAKDIVSNVGGTKNIDSLIHCVTRLRFVLKDENIANDNTIKNMNGVISVVKSGGQYQVVIGNEVTNVYDEIMSQYPTIAGDSDNEETSGNTDKKKDNLFTRFINMVVGIVGPLIGSIAVAGILKGLIALLLSLHVVNNTSSTYTALYALGDAMFYFLPVLVGFSAARRFKSNEYIGAGLGMFLCYPTLVTAYSAGKAMTFFGIPLVLANYTSSLFPVIFAAWLASIVEHYLKKHVATSISGIVVPLCSFVVAAIPTLLIAGPVLSSISAVLSRVVLAVYGFAPVVAGVLLGAFWQIIVIFGLHYAFIPVLMNNITTLHYDPINALMSVTVFAQMAGAIGVWLKTKQVKTKEVAGSAAFSAFLGVTEPAIYGISLPFKRVFAMTCIGGGVGGAIMALMNGKMYSFGANGIFAAPLFINPKGINISFWAFVIASLATIIVTVILTYFFGYKDVAEPVVEKKAADAKLTLDNYEIASPVTGDVEPLNQVNDEVFSSGAMGSGFAVVPTAANVYAPFDGTVSLVFDTKHAIGLISDNGVELLIHMGINTVELKGKPFDVKVEKGQKVKCGDLLAVVDWAQIKKSGFDPTTMVIVTNTMEYEQVNTPTKKQNAISSGAKVASIS